MALPLYISFFLPQDNSHMCVVCATGLFDIGDSTNRLVQKSDGKVEVDRQTTLSSKRDCADAIRYLYITRVRVYVRTAQATTVYRPEL